MLNIDHFIKRLGEIMENHQLSAAGFAERIGVQRSSVSHILSKRNKPSLDLVLKIVSTFDEITLDWLLFDTPQEKNNNLPTFALDKELDNNKDSNDYTFKKIKGSNLETFSDVEQIIQLYQDGSFRLFFPKS